MSRILVSLDVTTLIENNIQLSYFILNTLLLFEVKFYYKIRKKSFLQGS
jgi:hypothetical protein